MCVNANASGRNRALIVSFASVRDLDADLQSRGINYIPFNFQFSLFQGNTTDYKIPRVEL